MKLSHLNLMAFHTAAQTLNVTKAAQILSITQSAISQRISALEADLEQTVFIRDSKGLILTPEGEKLLRYTDALQALENEFLQEDNGILRGSMRIAGYSSIMRSKIIPTLSPFLRKNAGASVSFMTFEMKEIPQTLSNSRSDLIVLDYSLQKKGIKEELLGYEEYVIIESSKYKTPANIYLDHDPDDRTTELFFEAQTHTPKYKRLFMGDVYDIIQGVEEGLGRAAMSVHIIEKNPKIKITKGFKTLKRPVILHYFERPFYTQLQKRLIAELTEGF